MQKDFLKQLFIDSNDQIIVKSLDCCANISDQIKNTKTSNNICIPINNLCNIPNVK